MRLSDRQALFATLLAQLITWANDQSDMRVRMGDVYDAPKPRPSGKPTKTYRGRSVRSLHANRLAADLILDERVAGKWRYRTSTEAYRRLGERWKSLHEWCEWGGDGNRNDGNHFSLRYGGRW